MQLGFYFDQTRCINCFTCVVACKDWHDIPAGPASWLKVITSDSFHLFGLFHTMDFGLNILGDIC